MCRFEAGDKHLGMESAFDFGGIRAFEKEFDRFFQIGRGGFDGLSLTRHVEFRTERNITGAFLFNDSRIASRGHSPLPHFKSIAQRIIVDPS